ncbi:DUF3152 domain-containing protein [Streptomyces sp. NPDC048002]|uniref:DUF3152 domain-containing protein n=1 Tax=Streptomyces sp. NPDC048002 TaxID=3154344 RepID=UPI0033D6DE21
MGRHSRRGPAPKGETKGTAGRRGAPQAGPPSGGPRVSDGTPARGVPRLPDDSSARPGTRFPDGASAHPGPRLPDGTPAHGFPRLPDGTPAHGFPRLPDGTPAHGFPRLPDGTPAHGFPRLPDGTPAHGFPRLPDGTPAHGSPRFPDGTPAHGFPQVRGGHPEQRETGGGWGDVRRGPAAAGTGIPRQRPTRAGGGPRQDYLDAFEEGTDVFTPRTKGDPYASVTDWSAPGVGVPSETGADHLPPTGEPASGRGSKGRAFTGIAAAAIITVLAVVVAGQVTNRGKESGTRTQTATDQARYTGDSASRGDGRPTPSESPAAPPTYEQKMDRTYAMGATLDGSGKFEAVQGVDKAPGKGQKFTYRVDVEEGLGLDAELFAEAVQKTLNDDRSWAHDGARTFERIHSGEPDFVITLASPGTTADWCAKSGLDTTVDNVSCDSAATERVMINAYRWAQGSETYGDEIHAYRQMLINHEVGHRLGFHHVTCDKDGDLAPVMQQQTKFLDHDGITCRANPWAYPGE